MRWDCPAATLSSRIATSFPPARPPEPTDPGPTREGEWRIEAITARQVRASRPGQRRDLGFCTPQDRTRHDRRRRDRRYMAGRTRSRTLGAGTSFARRRVDPPEAARGFASQRSRRSDHLGVCSGGRGSCKDPDRLQSARGRGHHDGVPVSDGATGRRSRLGFVQGCGGWSPTTGLMTRVPRCLSERGARVPW